MKAEKTRTTLLFVDFEMCDSEIIRDEIDKELSELEAKAAKWDMIESAIENEVMFVDTHNDSINGHQTLTRNDLEYLTKKLGKA